MKKGIILILIFVPILLKGQEWAPTGATWYYDHYDGMPAYLTIINSVGDTSIAEVNCKILLTSRISQKSNDGWTYFWDTIQISRDYLYYSNDTIYHYDKFLGSFYPLYLFNILKDDTILVRERDDQGCNQPNFYCSEFEYTVDSISSLIIKDDTLKTIYNSATDNSDWVFNNSGNLENKPIIERIGSTTFLFGVYRNSVLEGDILCLRCYKDNLLSYKADYWTRECDYLQPLSGISPVLDKTGTSINILPNPFSAYFIINSAKLVNYVIYDSFGRIVLKGKDKVVDTEFLNCGVYLLKLVTDNEHTKTIKIIKHLP
jgi:hypothetical protein